MMKSFIYLDDYKMYSFSSQLFEGVTQYILKEQEKSYEEDHQQKGKFLGGRFMADMISQKNANAEMRYLHDFAFNLFEEELISRELLFDVTHQTTITDLKDKSFIRVKGKVVFEDYPRLLYTLDHFNEIGRAFGELQNVNELDEIKKMSSIISQTKEKEQRNKQKQIVNRAKKLVDEELLRQGIIIDDNVRKNILKILEYGYRNNYEVRMSMDESDILFTAVINPSYLKEPEEVVVSKYSRMSERVFTIVGVVTQSGNEKANIPLNGDNGMRNAAINLIQKIADLEGIFVGRSSNECIIDPIAIFTEVA